MKFTVNTKTLSSALSTVSRAVSTKSTLPALEGVLLTVKDGQLTVTGYNLEVGIMTTIPVEVAEKGSIVLSCNVFNSIVKKAPKEKIEISTDNKFITTVTSGNSTFNIVGISDSDYPDLPKFDALQSIKIKSSVLVDAISSTSYACSVDNSKPIYTGSLFEFSGETLTVVAVDGFRMAVKKLKVENNKENTSVVVPLYAQNEIKRLFSDDEDVEINLGQRHCSFKSGNVTIISRLIEGTFLEYNKLFSKDTSTTCIVDVNRFREAGQRCSILDNTLPVKICFDDGVSFKANSVVGNASDVITPLECSIEGDPVEIGFNPMFLDNALSALSKKGNIKISLSGGLKPATVTSENDDSEIHLIVPMRIAK